MNIKRATIGGAILAVATALPVVPADMELQYSFQTTPEALAAAPGECPVFEDTDGDGIISISIFKDRDGKVVCVQTSEESYEKMGVKDGYKDNTEKAEFTSLIGLAL